MEKEIKILVCAHREAALPPHKYFYPIQVGAALTNTRFYHAQDNTGDNISDKNPHFCELTAHYWAWKNIRCDIIGLNHYRRFFDFYRSFASFSPDRSFINRDSFLKKKYCFPDLEKLLNDYDIILPSKRHYPYNVGTQYAVFHIVNDLHILKEVIHDVSPEYSTAFDTLMYHRNAYSGYNMFITRWEHFDGYSEWLFKVLFELEKRVKLSGYPDKAKNPIGQVIDILGRAGDNTTEMHAILAEFGLPYVYPAAVEKAADKIPAEISAEEIARREDFRGVTTFTIDPKDAKDFDDALSIRKLKGGLWEVGVHIADVTHYVKEGGIIDKEAEKRATSVYLVDRTIPMLPERLCNFICSLRPDEEKLAYSVIFEMTEKGEVKNSRVVHTVIKSDRRFTYEEAQEIIETGKGDFQEEVLQLDKLAKILRENRFKAGAINFDRYEVKFEIDEKGKPVSVYFKESKDANKLIEEFMLLANRTVAEKIGRVPKGKKAKVLPYRIHDLPDPEKLDNLAQFIARFGYKLRTSGTKTDISKSINHLLDDIQGKKEENLIETVSIRAMQKARYSVHNVGHYGLAFDYYTHFTSPIRRYPDMMVHRLLTKYLDQGGRTVSEQKYEALCEHSSSMEQIASNAERASIKYKQVEFMTERLGQTFDGVISGVTEWGLYVELNENKCEGMIPIRDLDDDYYEFDEKNYCLRGRRKNKIYSLGDAITIKVARANLEKKQLDFALV